MTIWEFFRTPLFFSSYPEDLQVLEDGVQVFPIDFPFQSYGFRFLVPKYKERMESAAKQDQQHAKGKHWSHARYDCRCGMQRDSLGEELFTARHRLAGDRTLSCSEEESGLQCFLCADDE